MKVELKPIRPKRISDQVFDQLKNVIFLGELKPGEQVLPERDLADALGLSLVHTNKTLKTLRSKGLAQWSDGTLELRDIAALADLAMIDPERPQQRPLL